MKQNYFLNEKIQHSQDSAFMDDIMRKKIIANINKLMYILFIILNYTNYNFIIREETVIY